MEKRQNVNILKTYKDMQLERVVNSGELLNVTVERATVLVNLGIASYADYANEPKVEQAPEIELEAPLKTPKGENEDFIPEVEEVADGTILEKEVVDGKEAPQRQEKKKVAPKKRKSKIVKRQKRTK